MLTLQISNERNDLRTKHDGETRSQDDTDSELRSLATRRESIPITWLEGCYHFSTNWILRCLISDGSREEAHEIEYLSMLLPRIDSGIGIHLLGGKESHSIRLTVPKVPLPIHLTFIFGDGTTTKLLDYRLYSRWINVNTLIHELAHDGIVIGELWDVNEDMPIGSGDWDARIQPGSVINAWSSNEKRRYHADDVDDSSDYESDDDIVESDGDGDDTESEYIKIWMSSAKNVGNEHTWWFARWRQRVEKTTPGSEEVTSEPSWFFIVVWCTTTITIIALLILLNQ